jgi:alkaline phosphatase D
VIHEEKSMRTTTFARTTALAWVVLSALSAPARAGAGVGVSFTHGVASGEVTAASAMVWTRVDREAVLTLEVSDTAAFRNPLIRNAAALAANDFTAKVLVVPLTPATRYFYRWRHGSAVSEVGTFTTAPFLTHKNLRFAWSGDTDPSRIGGAPAFNNFETLHAAKNENPDFFVYLGDTIYADFRAGGLLPNAQTLDDYRGLYKSARDVPALKELAQSTSMYAIWDDHEVQNDWDGETVPRAVLEIGRKAFHEYMPMWDSPLLQDPDCATAPLFRAFSWGREADLFILDTRSCRSASVEAICLGDLAPTMPKTLRPFFQLAADPPLGCLDAIKKPSRTMLGRVQKTALKLALAASRARFKIVITPEPIQQLWVLPYDSWEGYQAERLEILNYIRDRGIENVLFLTTDGHQNVMNDVFVDKFTDPTPIAYEVMTGPIASVTWQKILLGAVGPGGLAAQQTVHAILGAQCRSMDTYSYGVVAIDAATGNATISVKDADGHVLVSQDGLTPSCTKILP